MNEKLKIQIEAEECSHNELNQLCKDPIIKKENNIDNDYKFKRQRLMDAHLSLIKSIESSFKDGIMQLMDYVLTKQNALINVATKRIDFELSKHSIL